jgi:hypothetical protein
VCLFGGKAAAAHNGYFEDREVFRRDIVGGAAEQPSALRWHHRNGRLVVHWSIRSRGKNVHHWLSREPGEHRRPEFFLNYHLDGVSRAEPSIQRLDLVHSPKQDTRGDQQQRANRDLSNYQ